MRFENRNNVFKMMVIAFLDKGMRCIEILDGDQSMFLRYPRLDGVRGKQIVMRVTEIIRHESDRRVREKQYYL